MAKIWNWSTTVSIAMLYDKCNHCSYYPRPCSTITAPCRMLLTSLEHTLALAHWKGQCMLLISFLYQCTDTIPYLTYSQHVIYMYISMLGGVYWHQSSPDRIKDNFQPSHLPLKCHCQCDCSNYDWNSNNPNQVAVTFPYLLAYMPQS